MKKLKHTIYLAAAEIFEDEEMAEAVAYTLCGEFLVDLSKLAFGVSLILGPIIHFVC